MGDGVELVVRRKGSSSQSDVVATALAILESAPPVI